MNIIILKTINMAPLFIKKFIFSRFISLFFIINFTLVFKGELLGGNKYN